METLTLEKKLTNKLKFDKKWLGAFMVAKVIRAVYEEALTNGVISWDVALAKIQSMVLMAALGCRAGDIASG